VRLSACRLKSLNISNARNLRAESLSRLRGLQLVNLDVSHWPLEVSDLAYLFPLTTLTGLLLNGLSIDTEGFQGLRAMPRLRHLGLRDVAIDVPMFNSSFPTGDADSGVSATHALAQGLLQLAGAPKLGSVDVDEQARLLGARMGARDGVAVPVWMQRLCCRDGEA
jgi:hypothetical protein